MTACKARKIITGIGVAVTLILLGALIGVYMLDSVAPLLGFETSNNGMGPVQMNLLASIGGVFVLWLVVFGVWVGLIARKEKEYDKKYEGDKQSVEYYSNRFAHSISTFIGAIITVAGLIGVLIVYYSDESGLTSYITGETGGASHGPIQMMAFYLAVAVFLFWLILYVIIVLKTKPSGAPPEVKKAIEKEEETTFICPECGADVPEDAEECPECGHSFVEEVCECPACGAEIPCEATVCPECGAEFEEEEEEEEELGAEEIEGGEKEELCECPECGAEIPCDATTCPNCGVEFEEEEEGEDEELCECPECGAEIPCDATTCPNCGVEFEE